MKEAKENPKPSHYVRILEEKCNGCVLCMKACPTKSIRIRAGQKAQITGNCIDCGECLRACPRGAIAAVTTGIDPAKLGKRSILCLSPVLYAQFGLEVSPERILAALRKEFLLVYDQSHNHEAYSAATELYIQLYKQKKKDVWPLISPVCPAVNRLIAYRFPSLIDHILPIIPPREFAARELRRHYMVFDMKEYSVYHVTPCAAKMISVKQPMFLKHSFIDGVLGINEVYHIVEKHLPEVKDEDQRPRPSGSGIAWCLSGGEIEGLGPGNYLAVSGMPEVIRYLEKIEMGLLRDIEYMELRACVGGCVGGPMTVADRYQARKVIEKLTRKYGIDRKKTVAEVRRDFEAGKFTSGKPQTPGERPVEAHFHCGGDRTAVEGREDPPETPVAGVRGVRFPGLPRLCRGCGGGFGPTGGLRVHSTSAERGAGK